MSLTEEAVLRRSKAKHLDAVHHLNVWGCQLTDISIVSKLRNLEILNLSCNSLKSITELRSCSKLKELYVRRNQLQCVADLQCLADLDHLKVLWVSDNPLCDVPRYREAMSRVLPQVSMLDNKPLHRDRMKECGSSDDSSDGSSVLQAVLLLLGQLDHEGLAKVHEKVYTLLK